MANDPVATQPTADPYAAFGGAIIPPTTPPTQAAPQQDAIDPYAAFGGAIIPPTTPSTQDAPNATEDQAPAFHLTGPGGMIGPQTSIGAPLTSDQSGELSGVSDILHGNIRQGAGKIWDSERPHVIPGSPIEALIQKFNPDFRGAATPEFQQANEPAINKPLVQTSQFIDKKKNPVQKGLAEIFESMSSPAAIATIVASGGMGLVDSPQAISMANRLVNAGFGASSLVTLYNHSKSFADSYNKGDFNDAAYQMTHALASGLISALTTTAAAGGPEVVAAKTTSVGQAVMHPVDTTLSGAAAIKSGAAAITPEYLKTAGEGRVGRAETLLTRAQKPAMGNTDYAERQKAALPDLAVIARKAEAAGTPVTNPRDAVAAINNRIGEIEDAIRAPLKDQTIANFKPRLLQVPTYINDAFEQSAGSFLNEDVEAAKDDMEARLIQIDTVPKLENLRKQLNEESKWGSLQAAPTPAVVAARATAAGIRDILYGTDNSTGIYERAGLQGDVRGARQRVGNLIEVRDNLDRAINRAEQTGDWSPVNQALSLGGLTTTGLGAGIGAVVGGGVPGAILGEAATQAHSFLTSKNPNLNTEWAFKHLAKSDLPEPSNPTYAPGSRVSQVPKTPPEQNE